jgi:myo-inositol 2-dehydrogenase / D-chiro-inositol 1-dehydrogenase
MLDAAPDAVVVASASARHAEHISACLPLQVPLFCEKPIATTLDEAVNVVEQTRRAGVELQVGFQRRFDPRLRELRSSVASGALGELYSITLASHDADPPSEAFAAECGGMFVDLHVHDFDVARWVSGEEVEEVFTVAARRGPSAYLDALGDVDTTAILLRMRSGLPVLIRGTRQDPAGYMMRTEVVAASRSATSGTERYSDYRERFTMLCWQRRLHSSI